MSFHPPMSWQWCHDNDATVSHGNLRLGCDLPYLQDRDTTAPWLTVHRHLLMWYKPNEQRHQWKSHPHFPELSSIFGLWWAFHSLHSLQTLWGFPHGLLRSPIDILSNKVETVARRWVVHLAIGGVQNCLGYTQVMATVNGAHDVNMMWTWCFEPMDFGWHAHTGVPMSPYRCPIRETRNKTVGWWAMEFRPLFHVFYEDGFKMACWPPILWKIPCGLWSTPMRSGRAISWAGWHLGDPEPAMGTSQCVDV